MFFQSSISNRQSLNAFGRGINMSATVREQPDIYERFFGVFTQGQSYLNIVYLLLSFPGWVILFHFPRHRALAGARAGDCLGWYSDPAAGACRVVGHADLRA
jgi:hypothetical protein